MIIVAVIVGIFVADLSFYLIWKRSENSEQFVDWAENLIVDDTADGRIMFPSSRSMMIIVGEMLEKGRTIKEIKRDYPYVTDQDIKFAPMYSSIRRGIADAKAGRVKDLGSFAKYIKENK